MRRARGFTLVELVVAITLLGILSAVGAWMISDTMQTSYITTHNHSSGSQARYAMERMTREIREVAYGATGGYSFTTKTATSVAFTKIDGTSVTITNSGTTLTMAYGATSSTLSDQISSGAFAFSYLDQVGGVTTSNEDIRFVQITMTVVNTKTGKTESLRSRIFLRNATNSA
jgi:prepilin-type N-terminal cleavage/methylation domain-containing protein